MIFVGPRFAGGLRSKGDTMAIDRELLEILRCPQCKGEIRLTPNEDGFICEKCRLKYPVRDGIPVMLIDQAEKI